MPNQTTMTPLTLLHDGRPLAFSSLSKRLLGAVIALACLIAISLCASADAAVYVVGSPLSTPATLNTAENLDYVGTNTEVPPSPEAPNGIFHTFHYGADTAIWNVAQASATPAVPVNGAVDKVSLEGCAQAAAGGPAPLTEIHFQDITPFPEGGAKVNLTSAGYQIPICGSNGASGSTISTYEPSGLCVSQGDYVDFNDEGGYVPGVYHSGVPYEVLGVSSGSTANSFIRNDGTGNGAVFSVTYRTPDEGFAENANEELMMQETIGTGANATHICGGTEGLPPPLPPIRVSPQTDGINEQRIVAIAVYCRLQSECKGTATMTLSGAAAAGRAGKAVVGHSEFTLPGNKTTHLPIRLTPSVMSLIRKRHGVTTTLTAIVEGKTITQTVTVKIL
jgi:hypothetical protein